MMYLALQGSMLARGWLAKESNAGLGGVMFGFGVAMFIFSFPGGVLADRIGKRLMITISYLILSVSSLWLAIALSANALDYWMLVGASAMQGMSFAFLAPARMAFTAELVPREMLPNAVALGQVSLNSMKVIGPMIAGWVIAANDVAGPKWLYYATALMTVMAMAMLISLPRGIPDQSRPRRRPMNDLVGGIRYVVGHPDLRVVVTTSLIVVMLGFPFITFLPRVVTELLNGDASDLGLLASAQGVGAFAAALIVASRVNQTNGWLMQTVGGIAFGAGLVAIGQAPNLAVTGLIVGFIGAANVGFQTANNTLALMIAEPEYHGRVQSFLLLSFGAFGIAALPLGILADAIGLPSTFAIMGTSVMAVVILGALMRQRRPALV